MARQIRARVRIRGIRPYWQHAFGPDALPLEKQEKTGVAGNDPQEWRRTLSVTKNGQLYADATYVFGSVVAGARNIKKGRGSIMPLVASTLQIEEDRVLFDRYFPDFPNGHAFDAKTVDEPPRDADEPVYLDVRGVRNPSTKARNVRYRVAMSPGWQTEFTMAWDPTVVSRGEMEAAVIDAGRLSGLGNGRSIGMGRFEVLAFEVEDAEKATAA